jgi:electron transfer flavoprotein alpha subunit
MSVWVEFELCNGCKRCLKSCPYDAIAIKAEKAEILERCTGCGACIEACRQGAIKTDVKARTIPDFGNYSGVWVLAETYDGGLDPVTLELLGAARQLADDLNQETGVVLLGHEVANYVEKLGQYGAKNIYLAEHEILKRFQTETYSEIIADLVKTFKPEIFLIGATSCGRELAPRLARRLKAGLTADCTALEIDPEEKILLQTRPAFGGNIMATIASRYSRPQMATVRPGVMTASACTVADVKIVNHPVKVPGKPAITLLEAVSEAKRKIRLGEAKIIVAGGRGTGGKSGFALIDKLAEKISAEVAGTRIAVEEGWVPVERQVGQTGQTVRPELYIACGISGAVQHRAGMSDSRYIIAINKDPGAPIFAVADWGIVGDLHQVIPEMLAQIDGEGIDGDHA